MLSVQENERLTRVGPGAPMGELLRRYWHPIAATAELDENPTKEVRLLGEDLALYRDRSGQYGLVERYCAHRRVNLAYGIPEERGLRCMYHGWLYDETGQCIEQPFEETVRPESRFKDKIKLPGYPVQEQSGLLFAYLGPAPAPYLPLWGPLVWDNVVREVAITEISCNWLQCMENSLDPRPRRMATPLLHQLRLDAPGKDCRHPASQATPPKDRLRRVRPRHHQTPRPGRLHRGGRRLEGGAPHPVPAHPVRPSGRSALHPSAPRPHRRRAHPPR